MPRNVLNVAAGFLPIVAADFAGSGVGLVVNLDPLHDSTLTGAFAGFVHSHPDVVYFKDRHDLVTSAYQNTAFDLVLSVSPYGFPLIDEWTDSRLRVGGYVVVVASAANPYARDARLFAPEPDTLKPRYEDIGSAGARWVLEIADQVRELYPSRTSDADRGTDLNLTRCLLKAR